MKKDSRRKSFLEAMFDIVLGFIIYTPVNFWILPYFTTGIDNYSITTTLSITILYTSIALVRKYAIRRLFINKNVTKTLQNLTKFIR